jgi:hypothetical protein
MKAPQAFLAAAAALALAAPALAQTEVGEEPGRRPRETVTTTLGGKKVTVEYGRPPLVGKTVSWWLDHLPPERIWRAGTDQVTSFHTEVDVLVGGKKVPAGKYSLYAHVPVQGPWTLIVNGDLGTPLRDLYTDIPADIGDQLWPQPGTYEESVKAKEVTRAPLKKAKAPSAPVERFTIKLDPEKDGASAITLTWGDQSWTAELKPAK